MNEIIDEINDESVNEITPMIKDFHKRLRAIFI